MCSRVVQWKGAGPINLDGRIILKCMFKKYNGNVLSSFIWLREGTSVGSNTSLGSIKCWVFFGSNEW
jgi:hypothetical protein